MASRAADAVAPRSSWRLLTGMAATGYAKSPAAATAGLFHLFSSSARSGEQACSREHDPRDKRSDAGKQQDVIENYGHDSLPRAEVPLPQPIGHPRTMAKRWQRPRKGACVPEQCEQDDT